MVPKNPHVKEVMDRLLDHVMVEDPVEDIKQRLRKFVAERDWEQFHDAKNLAASIAIETAELMEHFQWVRNEELPELLSDARRRADAGPDTGQSHAPPTRRWQR